MKGIDKTMYTKHSLFRAGITTLILLLLVGCHDDAETSLLKSPTTATVITQTTLPTQLPMIVTSPTSTAKLIKTETPLPISTWTPLPTLPADEAEKMAMMLLMDNAGCQLPCWWGITPGKSSFDMARQFLSTLAMKLYISDSRLVKKNGIFYIQDAISVDYRIDGKFGDGALDITAINGIVELIVILPRGTDQSYQIQHMLTNYGKPEHVLFEADTDYSLFHILLYYPNKGITAFYEGKFERLSEVYRICPQGIGPELWLWSPGNAFTLMENQFIGPDIIRLMVPITDVSSFDLDNWYQIYREPNAPCFEIPRNIWETP